MPSPEQGGMDQGTVNPRRAPLIQLAVNPYRPVDLIPARRHDDRGELD